MIESETQIRLSFFLGILLIMIIWELIAPRRKNHFSRWQRWPQNIIIVILNRIILWIIFPVAAVALAMECQRLGWGFLNTVSLASWLKVLIAVIFLDMAIYLQHVMVHAVPLLWRLHRVHHTDLDFDVTTASRFHPIEIVFSMLIKFAVIVAIGAPALAVLIFEVLLNGTAMFNHSNIKLPLAVDRIVRYFIVTPDMHRVHHSTIEHEANNNFGFNLSCWDRLFGTYLHQPSKGHENMDIGVEGFDDIKQQSLWRLLLQPFMSVDGYVINRRRWK